MGLLDSWSKGFKITILVIMLLMFFVIIGIVAYHINYRGTCVPNEQLNKCKTNLNQTELNLKNTKDRLIELESQKEKIIENSTICEEELDACKGTINKLNTSYNDLLLKFNALNKSYNQLLLNLTECKTALEKEKAKSNTECKPFLKQGITKSYIIISIAFFLFLLLPLKIEVGLDSKEKKTKRSIMVFIMVFSIGMFLLEYFDWFEYGVNILIILILSSVLAILTYVLHKK